MQPYLFPYIGYFQLLNSVDKFVIADDFQWRKGGWINRNRILLNNKAFMLTLSLKRRSHYDNILQFEIWPDQRNRKDLLNKIHAAYIKSPYFSTVFPLLKNIVLNGEVNLTEYIKNSLEQICAYLEIDMQFILSSKLKKNHDLRGIDRALEICRVMNAEIFINPIGGINLYDKNVFAAKGITIYFLKTNEIKYKQFGKEFISSLSIIDVMMFNSKKDILKMLHEYELL